MTLVKATLQEIGPGAQNPPAAVGSPVSVQLNPTSLRYQLSNNVDMGKAFGRSASQAQGSSSATLQFDLVFDTADEGTTQRPVDVRERTRALERFLLPNKKSAKSAPPRVKFTYGSFSVIGVMSALNQDFDLFAETGVPLRAKVAVTIKEQKPEFDAGEVGAGANRAAAAKPLPGSGRGQGAPPRPDRTGTALAGESAADFAARMGLDPAAWTSFAAGLGDTVSLPGGLRVDFSSSASATGGLGEQAAPTAAPPSGGAATAASDPRRAGDVSPSEATVAGGVGKVIEERTAALASDRAEATRAAFGAPAREPSVAPPPVTRPSAPPSDARAESYGLGVPLRPRVGTPRSRQAALVAHTRCGGREEAGR